MNNRRRHLIGCAVVVLFGVAFLVAGTWLGSSIGWDLSRDVSNESTIYGGRRIGPAWGVIPVLLLLGIGGVVGGLLGTRLPVSPDGVPDDLSGWDDRD